MSEKAHHRRYKDDERLGGNWWDLPDLDEQRKEGEVNRERNQVDHFKARQVSPDVPAHAENETSIKEECAQDAEDMRESERSEIAPEPSYGELKPYEEGETDDGVRRADEQKRNLLITKETQ
ncbi:hypothetical protein GCM10011313_24840 [Mycetocola zhadangensis]|nr:hypothetical protein GCM10011313_24840 [Mycetocola zhadangensis]